MLANLFNPELLFWVGLICIFIAFFLSGISAFSTVYGQNALAMGLGMFFPLTFLVSVIDLRFHKDFSMLLPLVPSTAICCFTIFVVFGR